MPSGIGTSYRSLADDVYKTTTIAENKFSVLDSVKKAFTFAGGSQPRRSDPLILRVENEPRVVPAAGGMAARAGVLSISRCEMKQNVFEGSLLLGFLGDGPTILLDEAKR
ncbi:hypothetical protein C0J52_00278 [Blattella germanica]|nr:hypothetical protein C0J52_00278 [Blattella germanica]